MNTKQVIEIALKAGEILLTSGAEIYRVEDTIYRICKCYKVKCEAFALPSGIFITGVGEEKEPLTRIKRIRGRTDDLHKIELVNSFSRELSDNLPEYEDALRTLEQVDGVYSFNYWLRFFASGINASVYTLLFRGSFKDGVAAFLVGILIFLLRDKTVKVSFFHFFEHFISGMVAAGISLVLVKLFPELNLYRIIIGSIVILLPGLALTNGVKDALYGDINSSLFRLSEAVFISMALVAGVWISLSIGLR